MSVKDLPLNLQFKIFIDTIYLKKMEQGWDEVHHKIKHTPLYLKKTFNTFISSDVKYNCITRLNTVMYTMGKKTYTWFSKMKTHPYLCYYIPKFIQEAQDLYCTNSYGYFLDDEYMDMEEGIQYENEEEFLYYNQLNSIEEEEEVYDE